MKSGISVVFGRRRMPSLDVPGELFFCYQPLLGSQAVLVWLNLRWLLEMGMEGDAETIIQQQMGIDFKQLTTALQRLQEADLLELGASGQYVLNEPLSAEAFAACFGAHAAPAAATAEPELEPDTELELEDAAKHAPPVNARAEIARQKEASAKPEGGSVESAAESAATSGKRQTAKAGDKSKRANQRDSLSADMQAVMQIYEKKMGVFGPSHFEKLRYWVEEMQMEGEVVAVAIEDAARQPRTRRMSYIEGILRNWHNEGIHTLRDALKANASRVLAGDAHGDALGANKPMEGVPNAGAYKHVDPKLVQKWKELYPDEYSS